MTIVKDAEMGGDARLEGHRIAVYHLAQYKEAGFSSEEIAAEFGLEVQEVQEALEYAEENPQEIENTLQDTH